MTWNLEEAIHYYKTQGAPTDQTALISLLREIQQENGGRIPCFIPAAVAEAYGIKESFLLAIIKRIPSLRLSDTHTLQLCAGPNCGKHTSLATFAEALQKEHGSFTLSYVPCMRMCGKGPNLKWDGVLYHHADERLIRDLVQSK